MSSSTLNHKFLIDENVRVELSRLLKQNKFDVKLVKKSVPDSHIASISKKQSLIFVTNDEDFTNCTKDEIFSVVWLRIPQADVDSLIISLKDYK